MPDFFTLIGAASTGFELYDRSLKVQGLLKMISRFLKDGRLKIILFGPGGVGKTTLAHYLSDGEYINPVYTESPTDEKFKIGKNVIGEYWVAPGQERRIEMYWPEMYRAISEGKVKGIINVVAYGYHSVDARVSTNRLTNYYVDGMSNEEFLATYLRKRRDEELEILEEIKHRIKDTSEKIHMITLVTKQDLWWNEKEEVQSFYTSGPYNASIEEVSQHKGTANFQHEYLSLSMLASNFFIGSENLKPVAEGYDEVIRLANIKAFLNQLEVCLR